MKKIIVTTLLLLCVLPAISQTLNGAWRLVEKNDKSVEYEVVKLYSNSYFTAAAYNPNTGEFIEAQGGTYSLDHLHYKENLEIDSKVPEHSGTTINYIVSFNENVITVINLSTEVKERWEKFDDADNYKMAFCWRIHKKKDEGDDDWRVINYAPRKTLKMVTNNRYQVLALNSETGQFVGSSGGNWTSSGDKYIENIEFFSKNQDNVGRSMEFTRIFDEGLWLHTGKTTKGEIMMEKWLRYK